MTTSLYKKNYSDHEMSPKPQKMWQMPSYTIREHGCSYDNQVRGLITTKIESTLELAPSNACTIVTITQESNRFKATMNISSYFASFESIAEGDDPYEMIKSICRDIRYQIHQWKKKRFENVTVNPEGYLQAI